MHLRKRARGQALYEFLGTLPVFLGLFFLILAVAQVWNQYTLAERLSLEGARKVCSGSAASAHTQADWSSAWPQSPMNHYYACDENGRCTYSVSSSYDILWTIPPITPPRVNVLGVSSCPESKFRPGNQVGR